jgi:hypothetical protein
MDTDSSDAQHSAEEAAAPVKSARPPPIVLTYTAFFFFLKDPNYLQSVTIHSANGGKGEGWHVEEYSEGLLC